MPLAIKVILFIYAISLVWALICKLLINSDTEYLRSGYCPWYIYVLTYLIIFDIPAFIYLAGWFIFECM